jgi:preprotein translocase subunit SecA
MRNFARPTVDQDYGALWPRGRAGLEHRWLNKSVETAQKRVEQRNYLIENALDFDDVMNMQREVVYTYRNETSFEEPRKLIYEVIDEAVPGENEGYLDVDEPIAPVSSIG